MWVGNAGLPQVGGFAGIFFAGKLLVQDGWLAAFQSRCHLKITRHEFLTLFHSH